MADTHFTNATGVGTTTPVLVALFNDAQDAHLAVTQLREQGFSSSQIGAAFRGDINSGLEIGGPGRTRHEGLKQQGESWWEKVKDAFRADNQKEEARREIAADPALDVDPYARDQYEYDFAHRDFAGSLSGAGVPADRSTFVSSNLQPGGAIVTVNAAERGAEAEQILTANHGRVHYQDSADAVGADELSADIAGASTIDAADSTGRSVTDTGYVDRRPNPSYDAATDLTSRRVDDADFAGRRTGFSSDAADLAGREFTDPEYAGKLRASASDAELTDEEFTGSEYADQRQSVLPNTGADRIQLFGEVLRVHKERISRGEVRLHKDVVTDRQTVEVPVTREELVLERVAVPADTPAPSANIGSGSSPRQLPPRSRAGAHRQRGGGSP